MALVHSTSGPPPKVVPEIARKSASFHPSIWGDKFLAYSNPAVLKTDVDHKEEVHFQLLKEEVKKMLVARDTTQEALISLIDDIQRLGLSYHFEAEIETLLQHIKDSFREFYGSKTDDDLHVVALCFRLLRQQGHFISSDVFYKFKDSNGKFKEIMVKDVRGMLSLLEATHLRVTGENILDDALEFTTSHLNLYENSNTNNPLVELVGRELRYPLRIGMNRLVARHYISIYHKFDWHSQVLLDLAKCDFNRVQKVHQMELAHITRWWKDLDFANKLPFARDRVVECYFWILGVYFEPQYAKARIFMTKLISLTSIVDDTFDVYGTAEELQQFTDAIQKWDISTLDQLPEYMRFSYQALLDVFAKAEEDMVKEGGPTHGFDYAKDAFKTVTRAYHQESKWCQVSYFPTFEEYMSVASVSASMKMLSMTSFVLMGNVTTKEAFEWMSKDPLIARAMSLLGRLKNDIVGHENERKRPHIPSAVECFMEQYGVPKETAYDALKKHIINAWKDINQECLQPIAIPMPLIEKVFNFICVTNLIYDEGFDAYTISTNRTKDKITSLLIDPIPE
ncbi:(-)-germacrene D synthase [Heracleum sosnowskyi]|uniref:(-)-germacrene D synthase n=1 Tax=Heracleum sosnowskyi TaxID=360622 RepID=A0AAD8I8X8_9APIA|nr:(-)-germacrene D synthase [Heracleum sosnowskyi]